MQHYPKHVCKRKAILLQSRGLLPRKYALVAVLSYWVMHKCINSQDKYAKTVPFPQVALAVAAVVAMEAVEMATMGLAVMVR